MYIEAFVKNVPLHGQNGKKRKKFLGYSKVIREAVFWIPIKNQTTGSNFNFEALIQSGINSL